eukprot:g2789.t1
MDITTVDLDFSSGEIDEDLQRFREDPIVKSSLDKGVDLRSYSRKISKDLRDIELASIEEYVEEAGNVARLHREISVCDNVLGRMQAILEGFQNDLGGISDDIKHLQDHSLQMNVKLHNRKFVEEKLRKVIDNAAISPELVMGICAEEVTEEYLGHLVILSDRLKYIQEDKVALDCANTDGDAGGQEEDAGIVMRPSEIKSVREILPELERLRAKAVASSRDFLLQQIHALKKSRTNVQMLQQRMVKFKYMYHFLSEMAPPVAAEIQVAYVQTMSKVLVSLFRSYHARLGKLKTVIADKNTTLTSPLAEGMQSAFVLGDRSNVLQSPDEGPVVVHLAEAEKKKFPYEEIFRSVQKHLMDSATSEFLFTLDFFGARNHEIFNAIYAKTLSHCLENLEQHLHSSYDSVGILLMIRLTHEHRMKMQRRRVPCLDSYLDRINLLLWPRFKAILDTNLTALRAAVAGAAGSTAGYGAYSLTRSYADFATTFAILVNADAEPAMGMFDSGVSSILETMQKTVLQILENMASSHKQPKAKTIFLVNNYSHILRTHAARGITEVDPFTDLLEQQQQMFVEEELSETFGRMISFVKSTEGDLDSSSEAESGGKSPAAEIAAVDESVVADLVNHFSKSWKAGINNLNQSVMTYFSDSKDGMEILKKVLTQLLLYYIRFQDIIKRSFSRSPSFAKVIVPTQTIIYEIKKYSRSF